MPKQKKQSSFLSGVYMTFGVLFALFLIVATLCVLSLLCYLAVAISEPLEAGAVYIGLFGWS